MYVLAHSLGQAWGLIQPARGNKDLILAAEPLQKQAIIYGTDRSPARKSTFSRKSYPDPGFFFPREMTQPHSIDHPNY